MCQIQNRQEKSSRKRVQFEYRLLVRDWIVLTELTANGTSATHTAECIAAAQSRVFSLKTQRGNTVYPFLCVVWMVCLVNS